MTELTIQLADEQIKFLSEHKNYGFKDISSIIALALENLRKEMERKSLEKSAILYAEVYEEDPEIKELTESAIPGWPE